MNKEKIKDELIKRFKARNTDSDNVSLDKASNDITEILNEVLKEENIELTDESTEELLVFLKPTNVSLVASAAKNDLFKSFDFFKP